jgi:hypothetical protein
LKILAYILPFFLLWSASKAQSPDQGQLYAAPAEYFLNYNFNATLNASYINVDELVSTIDDEKFASYKNLALYLANQFDDEVSKVRSIYTWIALNIQYDQNALFSGNVNSQTTKEVWASRLAVCEGYAKLFQEMCSTIGIESRIVKGYVKDFSYDEMRFPNHAWNSVKISGKWALLDVTWASVNNEIDRLAGNKITKDFTRKKLDYFFLVKPKKMVLTHLPEDPYWQLQNNYVSMAKFLQGESDIRAELQKPEAKKYDFEQLIYTYENLDSLDKSISFLERMEKNNWNKLKEYGLGIAYYYKAQMILKEANNQNPNELRNARILARQYYKKSLDQLSLLQEEDFGYEFSRDLVENVSFKIEVL